MTIILQELRKTLSPVATAIKTNTTTWFIGFVIATLGIFSSHITESIKFSLNRADLRTQKYEEIASEVSSYIFWSETLVEFLENDWMTKANTKELETEYNKSIMALRQKEFIYIAWVQKYWGKDEVELFESFMDSIDKFDHDTRLINDELDQLEFNPSKKKIDTKNLQTTTQSMKVNVDELRSIF